MKPLWNTYPVVWSAGALDSLNRLQYFKKSTWEIADASNIGNFSAIAFAFARMLEDSLKVPVGLVINAVGRFS
jgi:sialate O-acetylesterase